MISLKDKIIIAVDGYSSTGKSSFAKIIAKKLGYTYIDTGAMYRAVTLFAMENNLLDNTDQLVQMLDQLQVDFRKDAEGQLTYLSGKNVEKEIRGVEVSNNVSSISKIKEVREKLVALQQELGKNSGIVMDGRDIGTVVYPNAELKLFMTAKPEIRAKRRYKEMQEKGVEVSYEDIFENVKSRDYEDTHRKESPLRQADDAIVLDNSNLSFEQQWEWFEKLLLEKGWLV